MKHTYYERIAYGMELKRKKKRRYWLWGLGMVIVAGVISWNL